MNLGRGPWRKKLRPFLEKIGVLAMPIYEKGSLPSSHRKGCFCVTAAATATDLVIPICQKSTTQ